MRVLKSLFIVLFFAVAVYGFYLFLVIPNFLASAKLVHVIDADSLLVMEDGIIQNVQLIGVDGPDEGQCLSNQVRNKVADMYFSKNRDIRLEADSELGDTDIHGRKLRYVVLKDGSILNEKILEEGLGKEFHLQGSNFKNKERFLVAEAKAMEGNEGIWHKNACNGKF